MFIYNFTALESLVFPVFVTEFYFGSLSSIKIAKLERLEVIEILIPHKPHKPKKLPNFRKKVPI